MKDDVKTKAIKSLYKVQLREACFYFTLISTYLFGRKKKLRNNILRFFFDG